MTAEEFQQRHREIRNRYEQSKGKGPKGKIAEQTYEAQVQELLKEWQESRRKEKNEHNHEGR